MKYIFIIQGEGRGHLTQAISMYEMLTGNGDEITEVLVGMNTLSSLPAFFTEKIHCPVFIFSSSYFLFSSKNQKSLLLKTIVFNLWKLPDYIKSIRFIKQRINTNKPDKVLNFYEILTGLTYAFTPPKTPCICIGHQYLFLHPDFVFPKKNRLHLAGLLLFTRMTCFRASLLLALSFHEMRHVNKIHVVPPLVRKDVLRQTPSEGDYILGYMVDAGFSKQAIDWHHQNKDVYLHFFWNNKDYPDEWKIDETLTFHQLNDITFLNYMTGCKAYASTGGFESICEALYLQKPVMMIPAHIEQECNAFDAVNVGAGILSDKFNISGLLEFLPSYHPNNEFITWVNKGRYMFMQYL
ncbi:MAG: glycosyltransferase [Bacteroidales bacterium]|jgi:uncharacterized protein (TIGR00661 family)|nr:glycosyltransferase [Bacteroidales bacterium]